MAAKIVVACGSGIVTSQTVASKVERLLAQRGVDANVETVEITGLKPALRDADAYIAIVKTDDKFKVPVFNGVAFLTGMGQDAELDKLVDVVRDK